MGPKNALDPRVMAATTLHAQPGVYALLVGSGVSTGAGIPTGWGVVRELVRRAAAAAAPDDPKAPQVAHDNPEAWWAEHGDGAPLGYSNLLGSLANTPAARQSLLAGFFEPSDEDVDSGLKVPSAAHRAIANLVKRGTVRVIITTNFDRLTERALEDVGVSPQVITSIGGLAGMAPLQHAAATVIKLHGDYADLTQRNTVEELAEYPEQWNVLLDRVLSEYGLVISGWSADWDHALVAALERLPVRRYPMFWDSRSGKSETARRLLAQQSGTVLDADDADTLFTSLEARLEALDRLSEPPLTTALSITRLKRYLPDERHRIDLHDLVMSHVDRVVKEVESFPQHLAGSNDEFGAQADDLLQRADALVSPLAQLVTVGIQHDDAARFDSLWIQCLQRLLNVPRPTDGQAQHQYLISLRKYPALLFLRLVGTACLEFGRDQLLHDLLTKPKWRDPVYPEGKYINAANALADYRIVDGDLVGLLPRYTNKWKYPASRLLRDVARPILSNLYTDEDGFSVGQSDFEYLVALVIKFTAPGLNGPGPGEFVGDLGWNFENVPFAETRFRERAQDADQDWPWFALVGGEENFDAVLLDFRDELGRMRNWR